MKKFIPWKLSLTTVLIIIVALFICYGVTSYLNFKSKQVAEIAYANAHQPDKTIARAVADSIVAANGENISNPIVQKDIANSLLKYMNSFEEKHCPMIEELEYEMIEILDETNPKYNCLALFKYHSSKNNLDTSNGDIEIMIGAAISRDVAKTLDKNKKYKIKGIVTVTGFNPTYIMTTSDYSSGERKIVPDCISFGSTIIRNVEFTEV